MKPQQQLFPATVINDPLLDIATVNYSYTLPPEIPNDPIKIGNTLYTELTVHPFYKHLLGPLDSSLQEINERAHLAIQQNNLFLCTDGSYNPATHTGTHG